MGNFVLMSWDRHPMNSVKLVKYYLYCIRFLSCASLLKEKAQMSSPGFGDTAWGHAYIDTVNVYILATHAKERNFFVRFYG
jgi:hypothetical protein